MNLSEDFLAARGYLAVAREDCAKGFYASACLTAQKAAEVALQSYLLDRGMDAGSESLPLLLACLPGTDPDLARAAAELDRFRLDTSSPYRSAPGPGPDPTPEAAAACCAAAETIVGEVGLLFERLAAEGE